MDDKGRFVYMFTGSPSTVHDARMFQVSTFFVNQEEKIDSYRCLRDSAYIKNNPFIVTLTRDDDDTLTEEDIDRNTAHCHCR